MATVDLAAQSQYYLVYLHYLHCCTVDSHVHVGGALLPPRGPRQQQMQRGFSNRGFPGCRLEGGCWYLVNLHCTALLRTIKANHLGVAIGIGFVWGFLPVV